MTSALVRAVSAVAIAEMALNRRDPVAGALLAQATRAMGGLPREREVALAAQIVRRVDISSPQDEPFAVRKVAQALCRIALCELQAAAISGR